MKHKILFAALSAAFLAQGAAAQTATASSNQTANSASGSTSYGNVGNSTTNNMAPAANSNSNATSTTSSTSTNAGNSQNNGSASSINATINVVTPAATTSTATPTARQAVDQVISGEQTSHIDYSGSYTVKNVPSINASPLTSSNDTCMGSATGGVAVAGFGLTGGATYVDENCRRIKMSRELWNKGMKAASLAMDCMDRDAREALELTGYTCPQTARAQRQAAEEAQRREALAEAARKPAAPVQRASVAVPSEMVAPASLTVAPAPAAVAPAAAPAPEAAAPAPAPAPEAAAPAAAPVAAAPQAAEPPAAVPEPVQSVSDRAMGGAPLPPMSDSVTPSSQPQAEAEVIRRVDGVEQPIGAPRQ